MSDLLSLFDLEERAEMAALVRPAAHDDPLPPTWPANGIPPHPYASINRMMSGDEARELRADIDAHGLLERIVIFEGKILDGRNRYLECVALGRFPANVDWRTHPDFVEFGGKGWDVDRGTDPLAFVWGMEVRRHRSAKDTALAAARYMRFIADLRPEFADGKTAKLRLPTQAEIAKRHGISERLVNSAMVLLERAEPEVIAAVEQGTLPLTDAADVVSKLDREDQLSIAAEPDKKAAKAAVKAARPKASKAPPAPELPDPLSRASLMAFAESVLLKANVAFLKNDKTGSFLSAEIVLQLGREHGIIEKSDVMAWTRPALLAMGKLRDTMPAPAPKPKKDEPGTGPTTLPLGGEWTLKVGDLKAKHTASIAVFHEEDDTYSVSTALGFATLGHSSPFTGSYPEFRVAIGVAAAKLLVALDSIADADDSVTTDVERSSARAGHDWLSGRMAQWGIALPEPSLDLDPAGSDHPAAADEPPASGVDDAFGGEVGSYAALVERAAHLKGKHAKGTAEPIMRAGRAIDVSWQQIADDLGHSLGTVQGWSFKLGMTGKGTGRAAPRKKAGEGAAA